MSRRRAGEAAGDQLTQTDCRAEYRFRRVATVGGKTPQHRGRQPLNSLHPAQQVLDAVEFIGRCRAAAPIARVHVGQTEIVIRCWDRFVVDPGGRWIHHASPYLTGKKVDKLVLSWST